MMMQLHKKVVVLASKPKSPKEETHQGWEMILHHFSYQFGGGFAKSPLPSTPPGSSPALAATLAQPLAAPPTEPGFLLTSAGTSLAPGPEACRDQRESTCETTFWGRYPGCCPEKQHRKGGSEKRHPEPGLRGLTADGHFFPGL